MTEPIDLRSVAREIFQTALRHVDAGAAVRRAVFLDGERLTVAHHSIDLALRSKVYAIAIGKAAHPMARALAQVLGNRLIGGVISGSEFPQGDIETTESCELTRWQCFSGGHPLPNLQSLNAAKASFDLLKRADQERALIIFLISGGGSAMMEWPIDEQISLDDLREANHLLVSCGASIGEINSVRRAISAVKGGRLAARAPNANQLTLIVSDTNTGDEAGVASGPTIEVSATTADAQRVVDNYQTLANLPDSIRKAINKPDQHGLLPAAENSQRNHYVLLDNNTALNAAADSASQHGLLVEIASDIVESDIAAGCSLLLSRLAALRAQNAGTHDAVCLISGGEFLCPVRGDGIGGRNAETVLRCAIELDQQNSPLNEARQVVVLSAGTDGIDGNSPAAGAIAETATLQRARAANLDAHSFLNTSDAFSFFDKLGDAVISGRTGTNVRDLRIVLAR